MLKFMERMGSNIAQIIICVLVMPGFANLLNPQAAKDIVSGLTDFVPITDLWCSMLLQFDGLNGLEELIMEFEASSMSYLYLSVWQIFIIALIFEILSVLADCIDWRGLKIIPAVGAVFLAVVLEMVTDGSLLVSALELVFLFILYIIVLFMFSKEAAFKTVGKLLLKLAIDTYVALFSTMYLASLALIYTGRISGVKEIAYCLGLSFGSLLVTLVFSYLVGPRKNKKNKRRN